MNINISLDAEQQNTIIAALRWYQHSGMGDPSNRPDWLQELACPGPDGGCDSTSLCDEDIDELCERTLLSATDPGSALAPIAVLADRARAREALYFVVPGSDYAAVVTYHQGIQDADDCACQVRGMVYTAKAKGYCKTIDRTNYQGIGRPRNDRKEGDDS